MILFLRRLRLFILLQLLVCDGCVSRPFDRPAYHEVVPGVHYAHISQPRIPWSIHIVKFEYPRADLKLTTTLAQGQIYGLSTLAEQMKSLPPEIGQPVAGVNADFFQLLKNPYQGDPRGLQILNGELISAPTKEDSFWMDANGRPRDEKVFSNLKVIWPNGRETSVGLNEARTNTTASLLTPMLGPTTRTTNGVELILERAGEGPWLPLRPNEIYSARVRAVRAGGNTTFSPDILVLSLGKILAARLGPFQPGMKLKISTALSRDLKGVQTAIGGGPVLVADGKSRQRQPLGKPDHLHARNPRTAIGWNAREIFFVVVDGRKKDLSIGMTLPELADLMIHLRCHDAMNLDGGGSTTLWLSGKVVNHPSGGAERQVANALVLVRSPEKK